MKTREYADGYIEKRTILENGEKKTKFFAQIDRPGFWYGPLRDTREEALADGRRECESRGQYVPCFGMEP